MELSEEVLQSNGFDPKHAPLQAFEPGKCVRCGGTGYRGRIGVYQVMHVTDPVRSLILEKGAPEAITDVAMRGGDGHAPRRRLREGARGRHLGRRSAARGRLRLNL